MAPVIPGEAMDLQVRFRANSFKFFAPLWMTDFRESDARNLALIFACSLDPAQREIPGFPQNDKVR